jgi:hypothetical protein
MNPATIQKADHAAFSQQLKAHFEEDVIMPREIFNLVVETLNTARKALFVQGYSPEKIDYTRELLKKWEV